MHAGLSALVVHDLKNRLLVHGRRIAELRSAHAALADALAPIQAEALTLQRRLIAFLTLYRSDTLGVVARDSEESPQRSLAQTAVAARAMVEGRGIGIEVDASEAPDVWFFDAYLVGLALEAAVDNAARLARSLIRLSARMEADTLVLAIEDDGPGLGGDSLSTSATGSTGLGTELCRMVARLHACEGRVGEVRLMNRKDGAGARFELRLP